MKQSTFCSMRVITAVNRKWPCARSFASKRSGLHFCSPKIQKHKRQKRMLLFRCFVFTPRGSQGESMMMAVSSSSKCRIDPNGTGTWSPGDFNFLKKRLKGTSSATTTWKQRSLRYIARLQLMRRRSGQESWRYMIYCTVWSLLQSLH